jgi:threonine dehydratase
MDLHSPIPLAEIRDARERLAGAALRTPLLRWNDAASNAGLYLKPECLQPIGAFKLRGAGNAMLTAPTGALRDGVWTASAGNMAQGVAWFARRLGIPCSTVVPDNAPEAKLAPLRRLGANIVAVPYSDWWNVLMTHRYEGCPGMFIHPVCNPYVMAGNGTIGLEILEDLPEVDTILVPIGGGGLSCGIASAAKAIRPAVKVIVCEPNTAAPWTAAFKEGRPVEIPFTPSFVDGAGGRCVLPEMWPLGRQVLDGAIAVPLEGTADAIRLLMERHHIVAEGAGALPVAAALAHPRPGKTVCVVSGGNIDPAKLAAILHRKL